VKKESADPFMDWKEKLMDKEQSGNETHKTVSPASLQGTPCFVAKNATIVGNVTLGKESTVWFQAVIRGDANRIVPIFKMERSFTLITMPRRSWKTM